MLNEKWGSGPYIYGTVFLRVREYRVSKMTTSPVDLRHPVPSY